MNAALVVGDRIVKDLQPEPPRFYTFRAIALIVFIYRLIYELQSHLDGNGQYLHSVSQNTQLVGSDPMFTGTYKSFDFTARLTGFDYSNGSKYFKLTD